VSDGGGRPRYVAAAGANRHDSPLLGATLAGPDTRDRDLPDAAVAQLDRGDDSGPTRAALDGSGFDAARRRGRAGSWRAGTAG
jgi:hypothetical protein